MTAQRNPYPTVDIIIEIDGKILLIERKYPPPGWAIRAARPRKRRRST